jgi:flavin-dependent dehydrogenase
VEAADMTALFDAIVLGGGPAGAAAALLLARAGWAVRLYERKVFPRRKVCGEYLSATNLPLLDCLGLGEAFRALAGPPVRHVALFAGRSVLRSALPRPDTTAEWGRALGRESLDSLLLDAARQAGVEVRQPWAVTTLWQEGDRAGCRARSLGTDETEESVAPVVVAAHGSWDAGALPTQPARQPPQSGDLFGFKAHFANSDLPEGLMPLLAFPGGYGGMVRGDGGRVSLSCCVRRDALTQWRRRCPGDAGDAVLTHLHESCLGVRRALAGAQRLGAWLAAGPIRPGIRLAMRGPFFPVGNAAGEAHPVIAEGISMALQSAWLLARHLIDWRCTGAAPGRAYAADWRRHFAARLRTSRVVAEWAMHPAAVAGLLPILACFPALLNWGARLSGKATCIVRNEPALPRAAAFASSTRRDPG